jgi:DNA-binding response OmpR family regulator
MASVLVVEDDRNLRDALADNLRDEGFAVRVAGTVKEAHAVLEAEPPDVVVLDLMLPDGDGTQVCQTVRTKRLASRVLMLTARTLEDDVVKGFDAGADDYLGKPYRLRELLARVKRLAAGGAVVRSKRHQLGGFAIDEDARTVVGPKGPVELTKKEFDLLVCLLLAGDAVLSRDEILDRAWGETVMVDPHTVDNFISSLKKKLVPAKGFELKTVRGVGFRLARG